MSPPICSICNSPRFDSAGPCSVCGAPPLAPARNLPVGTRLQNGRFTLGRVLGKGGFGITYKGAHRHLQRVVAIKELFPDDAVRRGIGVSVPEHRQQDFWKERERILEEARSVARLVSPHVVTVHDVFLENGTAYIVMEYLEGQTLQDRIEEAGSLSVDDVRAIAVATCDALIEVHRQSLLHRDIKPSNIMLTRSGRTVLIDFGSARPFALHQTVRHTRILTTEYAAPEMYSTQAQFGPYTDIFCLGGTLYHALTGNPPPSCLDRLHNSREELEFPNALQGPLCNVIRQALQVRVENRPQSAATFKSALLSTANPIAEDNVASVSVPDTREAAVILPLDTMKGHTDAVLSVAFHPSGMTLASGGKDGIVRFWDEATGNSVQTLQGHKNAVHSVAFSPDGQILASGGVDGTVRLWDADEGTWLQTLRSHRDAVHSVAFSPDGQIWASGGTDGTVHLWDADSSILLQTLRSHRDAVYSVAFSPDGRILASGGADGTVHLWGADEGTWLQTLQGHKNAVHSVAFSPDGRILASGGADGDVYLWDTELDIGSDTPLPLTGHRWKVYSVAFSPDGLILASGGSDGVRLWDAADAGTLLNTLTGYKRKVYSVVFSPDGLILASGGADGTVRFWE